jgi:hypothetical protein
MPEGEGAEGVENDGVEAKSRGGPIWNLLEGTEIMG